MKNKTIIFVTIIINFIIIGQLFGAGFQQQRNRQRLGRPSSFYIKGKVENLDGNPIGKAVIVLPELSITVESDDRGRFEIGPIPRGFYHLEAMAEGYMDYSSDLFELKNNYENFLITMVFKIQEQIVVTATKTAKRYAETPVKTEIITRAEINQKVAANLAESLSLTPGVRVENDCQNCNFTQVRINGMEGKYTQVLINGLPVISAMTGVYGLEQIPASMIEQIEIVKGGGSSLYGGSAVAGVINIITREPRENETNLKLLYESIAGRPYLNFSLNSSHVSNDLNTRIYLFANYQKRDPIDLNADNFSELGMINNTSFGINFYQDLPSLKGKARVEIFRIVEDRRGGNLISLPPHEADVCEWAKSDQLGLSAEWNQILKANLFYNFSLSYLNANRNTYYGSHQDLNAYGKTENPLFIGNGQLNWQTGNHVLCFGFQLKRDKINDQALSYDRVINQVYYETGIYIQDEFLLSPSFSLLSGLRLSKHTALSKPILTPRLSLLARLSRELTWRTTFSTGFRAPQVFDEDLHITQVGGEGMIIVNSPNLKQESSYSLTAGLDFGKQYASTLFQFSLEGFYNRLQDSFVLHEIDRIENARVMERTNSSGARVYGGSLVGGVILKGRFSLSTGWTFQQSRFDEPEPEFNSLEFFRAPRVYGYASAQYKNDRLLSLDLSLNYTGSMKVPHYTGFILEDRLEKSPPFWEINLKLQRRIQLNENLRLDLLTGIFNLLNSYQKDLDIGADRDSGYVYGPSKPRTFYLGMEFTF